MLASRASFVFMFGSATTRSPSSFQREASSAGVAFCAFQVSGGVKSRILARRSNSAKSSSAYFRHRAIDAACLGLQANFRPRAWA